MCASYFAERMTACTLPTTCLVLNICLAHAVAKTRRASMVLCTEKLVDGWTQMRSNVRTLVLQTA